MKRKIFSWLYLLIGATAFLFWTGCEERAPSDTGLGVLPPGDIVNIEFTDTFKVSMETQRIDRINTNQAGLQLFGNYVDPEFGRISATAYTEVEVNAADLNFGQPSDLRFSSLELVIPVVTTYGRGSEPQIMRVFELAEKIPEGEDPIFSDRQLSTTGPELSGNYEFTVGDSISLRDIFVPLDSNLGKRLLFADSTILNDEDAFEDAFKGFQISTSPVSFASREPGAIFGAFLTDIGGVLRLSYQRFDPDSAIFVDETFDFAINTGSKKFHAVERTDFQGRLLGEEERKTGSHYEFVQAGGLVQIRTEFPDVTDLGLVGVNRAELEVKVVQDFLGSNERFAPPGTMTLNLADENGKTLVTDDGIPIQNSSASYNSNEQLYSFPVTNYLQEVLSDRRENFGFIISPTDSAVTINRAVVGSQSHPTLAPRLKITFTRLPK
ncbi:MAG: DUF4270 family protein [Bacteroidota bacterium]